MKKETDIDHLINLVERIKSSKGSLNSENISSEILSEIASKLDKLNENSEKLNENSEKLWKVLLIAIKDRLNIEEASIYTSISKSEFYQKTSKKEIAFSKPVKQIFFKKEVLNDFLDQNPQ